MSDVISKEALFNHPIDKVWSAISIGEEISKWFIKADFKAEKGYHYSFHASEEKGCITINGEIKEAKPYTLIYTWMVQDTDVETTVKWTLEAIDGKTKLVLEHSGISNYSADTAVTMFGHFSSGWDNCINLLTEYLTQEVHAR